MDSFKKDPAMQKLKELTGGLASTDYFDKKLKNAGLTIQEGYEIKEELKKSIKLHEVEVDDVETRLNYLIDQRKKSKGSKNNYNVDDETRIRLFVYIDQSEINLSSKAILKKEVQEGKIKRLDDLVSKVEDIMEEESKKVISKNKSDYKPKSSSSRESQNHHLPSSSNKQENESKIKEIPGLETPYGFIPFKCLEKTNRSDKIKEIKFLLNQEHNLFKCPSCGEIFIYGDKFCYNCGFDMLKYIQDLESGKIKISEEPKPVVDEENKVEKEEFDVEDSKKESKVSGKKSTEPKQKVPVSAATKRAINLKFASVVFLNEKSKNPTKLVKESYYKNRYDTRLAKIKKFVREEGYLVDGDPLTTARSAKVDDLKKVLKKHDLMVSGTKDELLQRLGENLSEEELKKAFPKKSLKVTDKGLEFIEKNKYVFFYDQITPLRNRIPIGEYDSIFEGVEVSEDKEILGLIEGYLNERGDSLANILN